MNRSKRNTSAATAPEQHIKAVGRLLTPLRKQLIKSGGEKGTYSDYLRLLEFYSHTDATQPREIVGWVDDPKLLQEESPLPLPINGDEHLQEVD